MAINDKREDKAQLDRREFDLDAEEQDRQRKERDVLIAKVRRRSPSSLFNPDTRSSVCLGTR